MNTPCRGNAGQPLGVPPVNGARVHAHAAGFLRAAVSPHLDFEEETPRETRGPPANGGGGGHSFLASRGEERLQRDGGAY